MLMFGKSKQALTFFGEEFEVIGVEGMIGAEVGKPLKNNFVLTLLGFDIFNYNLLPNHVLKDCQKFNVILLDTTQQQIYRFTRIFFAAFIPFTIQITVAGGLRIDTNIVVCPANSQYTLELYPSLGFSLSIYGSIGLPFLSAGIEGEFKLGVGVSFTIGRATCRECVRVVLIIEPITLTIFLKVQLFTIDWKHELVSLTLAGPFTKPLLFSCKNPTGQIDNAIRNQIQQEDLDSTLWGAIETEEITVGPLFGKGPKDPKTVVKLPSNRKVQFTNLITSGTMNFFQQIFDNGPMILKAPMFSIARKFIESDLKSYLGDKQVDFKERKELERLVAGKFDSFTYIAPCSPEVEPVDLSLNFNVFPEGSVVPAGDFNELTYMFIFKFEKTPESEKVVIFSRDNGFEVSLTNKMKLRITIPLDEKQENQSAPGSSETIPGNKKESFTDEGEADYSIVSSKEQVVESSTTLKISKWYSIGIAFYKNDLRISLNGQMDKFVELKGKPSHGGALFIPPKYEHIKKTIVGNMCGFKALKTNAGLNTIEDQLTISKRITKA